MGSDTEIDLKDTSWEEQDWIDMARDRDRSHNVVNTLMRHRIPENVGNFLIN